MSEQKQQNVKELQDRVVPYFCARPANFLAGLPYNCGESILLSLAFARGIGCARAGVLENTLAGETGDDLFGEETTLCGRVSSLITAGFGTLVEGGYQPWIEYSKVYHGPKLIINLIYQGGLSYMHCSVSNTAEYGDYAHRVPG